MMTVDRLWWLALAAAALVVLLISARDDALPAGVAALVNGVPVSSARVAQIAAGMRGDSPDKRDALTRAIDEALWLQEATRAGLLQDDSRLRDAVIADAQAAVFERAPLAPPTPAQLRALYGRAPERFRQLSGMSVQRWVFSSARGGMRSAWERATQGYRLLVPGAGPARLTPAALAALAALSDADPRPLPARVAKLADLRGELGVELTILVAQLRAGELSRPVGQTGAVHLYLMRERDTATVPSFAAAGPRVADAFLRDAQEQRLQLELQRLRAAAHIRRAAPP